MSAFLTAILMSNLLTDVIENVISLVQRRASQIESLTLEATQLKTDLTAANQQIADLTQQLAEAAQKDIADETEIDNANKRATAAQERADQIATELLNYKSSVAAQMEIEQEDEAKLLQQLQELLVPSNI